MAACGAEGGGSSWRQRPSPRWGGVRATTSQSADRRQMSAEPLPASSNIYPFGDILDADPKIRAVCTLPAHQFLPECTHSKQNLTAPASPRADGRPAASPSNGAEALGPKGAPRAVQLGVVRGGHRPGPSSFLPTLLWGPLNFSTHEFLLHPGGRNNRVSLS